MRWITLRLLALVVLLGACGCGAVSSSQPSEPVEEVAEPEDAPPEPEARIRVERHTGYGADWDAAYDVIVAARLQAFARLGVTRVVLSPHAVGGRNLRHIVRADLHFDGGESRSIAVVSHGRLLERGAGPEGLSTALAGLGFPGRLLPAPALTELVCYFEVAIDEHSPWCSAIGDDPQTGSRIEKTNAGAVLFLRPALVPDPTVADDEGDDEGDGEIDDITLRIEIHFDAEAGVTVHHFRRRPNGSWHPLSLEGGQEPTS
jgi:hypothetical protein